MSANFRKKQWGEGKIYVRADKLKMIEHYYIKQENGLLKNNIRLFPDDY